jgi:hypothetical protein
MVKVSLYYLFLTVMLFISILGAAVCTVHLMTLLFGVNAGIVTTIVIFAY